MSEVGLLWKNESKTLTGVAPRLGHCPTNGKVASLTLGQGAWHRPGLWARSQVVGQEPSYGRAKGDRSIFLSLSFSSPSLLSKNKQNLKNESEYLKSMSGSEGQM